MSSARKGFSLIEILIACVLLLLILGLIMEVVIPMGRGTVRGSQQIELQQVGTMAVNRIAEDLSTAPPAGITRVPSSGPPTSGSGNRLILSIQALTGVDTVGQQVWADHLIILWWEKPSGKLYRMKWPPGYPLTRRPDIDEPFKPTASELQRLCDNPRDQEKLLGIIKSLDIDLSTTPHVLRLFSDAPAPDGAPPETFTLERRVYLRNERY
jgi:prepilin-type N-terminal cleavage/methylation domain-containing protein